MGMHSLPQCASQFLRDFVLFNPPWHGSQGDTLFFSSGSRGFLRGAGSCLCGRAGRGRGYWTFRNVSQEVCCSCQSHKG